MKIFARTAALILMMAFACSGSEMERKVVWNDNYAAAIRQASAQKLPILMVFSGSDWCVYCKMLEKSVFSQPEFAAFAAQKKVILFFADMPRRKKITPEILAQNRHLLKVYNIEGFPTVILTDPAGKEFARTQYRPGGAKKYVAHLNELLKKAPK